MLDLILAGCFAVIYALLDAVHDNYVIKWKETKDYVFEKEYSKLWHRTDAIIKGFVCAIVCLLLFSQEPVKAALAFSLMSSLRWLVFDASLNSLRGKSLTYIGNSDTDNILKKIKVNQVLFKVILIAIIIYLLTLTA